MVGGWGRPSWLVAPDGISPETGQPLPAVSPPNIRTCPERSKLLSVACGPEPYPTQRLVTSPNRQPPSWSLRPWVTAQEVGRERTGLARSWSHEAAGEQDLSLADGQRSRLNHPEKLLEPPGWWIPGQTVVVQSHRAPQD